jgi:8-oxo-dGTP diphosphatase
MVKEFSQYPRPALAVDPAVLTIRNQQLSAVLWKREWEPAKEQWALPGVFVNYGETLEDAVSRALQTKLMIGSVQDNPPQQICAWNKTGRDPRGWVVTIAYLVLIPGERLRALSAQSNRIRVLSIDTDDVKAGAPTRIRDDAGNLVNVAFDHDQILGKVLGRLREEIWQSPLACSLLPEKFTLYELRRTFEAIVGRKLNKDSFRKRVTETQAIVRRTGQYQDNVHHRPAELFRRVT